jgi:hypothetical protein
MASLGAPVRLISALMASRAANASASVACSGESPCRACQFPTAVPSGTSPFAAWPRVRVVPCASDAIEDECSRLWTVRPLSSATRRKNIRFCACRLLLSALVAAIHFDDKKDLCSDGRCEVDWDLADIELGRA